MEAGFTLIEVLICTF
ncbi:MAG: prepilin-type N-terminal cleavage/methylation domain-containing protein, partial [Polynucleobacter victoriensis]